jgi:hypothetical protein
MSDQTITEQPGEQSPEPVTVPPAPDPQEQPQTPPTPAPAPEVTEPPAEERPKAISKGVDPSAISKDPDPEPEMAVEQEPVASTEASTEVKSQQTKTAELIAPKKKVWIVGKPPEAGGESSEFETFVQRPLSVFNGMYFFGRMADTIVGALDKGTDLDQILGNVRIGSVGSGVSLGQAFEDPGQMFMIFLRLFRAAPDFVLDSFVMWLEVKPELEFWFRQVMRQRHDPENEEWGPTQEMIGEIIEVFLEQNYEEVRRFFTVTLQKIAAKMRLLEEQRKEKLGLVSGSALSKP